VGGLAETIPGKTWPARVADLTPRAGYVDARIETERSALRYLFPDVETCRRVLRDGAEVEYVNSGTFGQVRSGTDSCEAIGTLSLAEWRDRRPSPGRRAGRGSARPRAHATYEVFYTDEELIFLRGSFPLTDRVGISGGRDTMAVIPKTEVCQELLERNVARLEYRERGLPLVLLTRDGECPVQGLVLPPRR
jgi:hypothetical protein